MGDINNLVLRDRDVYFDGNNVGFTLGGIELTFEREYEAVRVDQYSADIDKALTSENLMITFYLAEISPDAWKIAVPEAEMVTGSLGKKVYLGRDSGDLLRAYAREFRFHARNLALSNKSQDLVIYKGASVESIDLNFKKDEQSVIKVTVQAFVDESRGDGRRLGQYGADIIS